MHVTFCLRKLKTLASAPPHPYADALLHVDLGTNAAKGFLITGSYNFGGASVPNLGDGSRLMFYHGKAAFRAGLSEFGAWDNLNVGYGSTGFGYSPVAKGDYSTAGGYFSTAQGFGSTAMGFYATAGGDYSTSLGYHATAGGNYSTALGHFSVAGGNYSTATGYFTTASGLIATAMGTNVTASGDYSVALGTNVSTNGKKGAFFLGDSDPYQNGVRDIGFNDQIAMRFNGGYYFISSDIGSDIGVRVSAGGNSWSALSDVKRKENFLPVNGELFLEKISKLPLSTWNYKGQSPKTFRHYGPMAQDFFAAFGKDELGIIGCDTLINQQDFLGVNLIAIQALEKRTGALQMENNKLKMENAGLLEGQKKLEAQLQKLEALLLKE